MSRYEPPSPSPLDGLAYRCYFCRQEIKPELQGVGYILDNMVVIERDGSVRKVCRRCASLFQLRIR